MATVAYPVQAPEGPPASNSMRLRIFDYVPRFHDVVAVDAGTDTPLLRGGEVAVFDTAPLDPDQLAEGLYCIEYQATPASMPREMFAELFVTPEGARLQVERRLVQLRRHPRFSDRWLTKSLGAAIGTRIAGFPTFVCSDGPWEAYHIAQRLLGRVVGIYRPAPLTGSN